MRQAIRRAGGNTVIAAHYLNISVRQLHEQIECSAKMRDYLRRIRGSWKRIEPEWREKNLEEVEDAIRARAALYRLEALDAIREIATMPLSKNPGQNQVKLMAAQRLYSETGGTEGGDEFHATLRALNADYERHAPRIKSIRERVVEFEEAPAGRVLEAGQK